MLFLFTAGRLGKNNQLKKPFINENTSDSEELRLLAEYTAKQIKEKANGFGLTILTSKKKINLPNDKKEMKNILRLLDEEIYKGVFSDEILQTNRRLKMCLNIG